MKATKIASITKLNSAIATTTATSVPSTAMGLDRSPLGIAGAGTMGAGIAAAARAGGLRVLARDPDPAARARVAADEWTPALAGLAACDVVIEAAPSRSSSSARCSPRWRTPWDADGAVPARIVDCGATEDDPPLQGGPQLLLLVRAARAEAPLAAQ
jgi:hypothetical protein